jgi:SNF2 family DNA or RNA helicase
MIQLYDFQKVSVKKLTQVTNGLNCDDMGLGKTVQGIAIDFAKRNTFKGTTGKTPPPTLIVAPGSTLETPWETHLFRYWPQCKVNVIDPKKRHLFIQAVADSFTNPRKRYFQYHVTHWESLRLMPELQKYLWFHVIADEVQRAKNRKAQQTRALKKLHAMNKLGLSGTAADNMPDDLWSILNWLYPRTWTSYNRYVDQHIKYDVHVEGSCECGKWHKRSFRVVSGVAATEQLHTAMAPFYVRRTKDDPSVNIDLPEKTYSEVYVTLHPQQRRAYDAMRSDMLTWVGKHEDQPLAAPVVISQLIRLQQFAVAYGELHPVVRGDKTSLQLRLTEPSSKLDALMEMIEDNAQESFVVFSHSRQVIDLLVARLERKGISYVRHTGNTPQKDRGNLVERFQRGDARVFAGTIATGGMGITLTAARKVAFLDRPWSPSLGAQAEDRCHRIGQKRNVQIIDFVAKNTVDLGRLQKVEMKWTWVKAILGDDVTKMQHRFIGDMK